MGNKLTTKKVMNLKKPRRYKQVLLYVVKQCRLNCLLLQQRLSTAAFVFLTTSAYIPMFQLFFIPSLVPLYPRPLRLSTTSVAFLVFVFLQESTVLPSLPVGSERVAQVFILHQRFSFNKPVISFSTPICHLISSLMYCNDSITC